RRTERLFNAVMVAIASISLLVGGIGIMNIMLASILERTREIGVRRAVGARQFDIVRQFVVEATIISFVGGSFGIVFGFVMSRLIAWLAGWSTIVTASSIILAFAVSISVGLIFGIYPAMKAARLDLNSTGMGGEMSRFGVICLLSLLPIAAWGQERESYRDFLRPEIRSPKLAGPQHLRDH